MSTAYITMSTAYIPGVCSLGTFNTALDTFLTSIGVRNPEKLAVLSLEIEAGKIHLEFAPKEPIVIDKETLTASAEILIGQDFTSRRS